MNNCCKNQKIKSYRKILSCENCGVVFGPSNNSKGPLLPSENNLIFNITTPISNPLSVKVNPISINIKQAD